LLTSPGDVPQGLSTSGYTATYGADGLVQSLAYDPNNPYSQAALARTIYQQSKSGTTNSMAGRGLLYSSAINNAQNQNDTNFNVGEDSRQKGLIGFLNGLTGQEKGAKDATTPVRFRLRASGRVALRRIRTTRRRPRMNRRSLRRRT
jgi:hypothetical protein